MALHTATRDGGDDNNDEDGDNNTCDNSPSLVYLHLLRPESPRSSEDAYPQTRQHPRHHHDKLSSSSPAQLTPFAMNIARGLSGPRGSDGLFVPASYVWHPPSSTDMHTASVFFGITLGVAIFAAAKASRQSLGAWKRSRRVTPYVSMIWGHWASNMGIAPLTNFYLRGYIKSSFWLWFFIVFLWCFQVQLLMQIIINRVALLIAVPATTSRIKWGVFLAILVINISVFIIWIPAQLQISPRWVWINSIWDRTEKCIFLAIDASLNCLFLYLVRTRLIANGLDKYRTLFRFNLIMVIFSVSLDVILVGLMSLPNHIVYLQFQCTAYITKLHIEMNMADLIRKVVRASNNLNACEIANGRHQAGSRPRSWTSRNAVKFLTSFSRGANNRDENGSSQSVHVEHEEQPNELEATSNQPETLTPPASGIKKTVRTEISTSSRYNAETTSQNSFASFPRAETADDTVTMSSNTARPISPEQSYPPRVSNAATDSPES